MVASIPCTKRTRELIDIGTVTNTNAHGMSRRKDHQLYQDSKRRRLSPRFATDVVTRPPNDNIVAFKEAWKCLHRAGWTSKQPPLRSLDLRYRYVRPGGNLDGREGDDFFVGEQALTDYYNQTYCGMDGQSIAPTNSSEAKCDDNEELGGSQCENAKMAGASDRPSNTVNGEFAIACNITAISDQDIRRAENLAPPREPHLPTSSAGHSESRSSGTPSTKPVCAVCRVECSTARSCSTCGAFLHHFCSHDVCVTLKLRGPDGQLLSDFGDACYCSGQCYQAVGISGETAEMILIRPPSTDQTLSHGSALSKKRKTKSQLRTAKPATLGTKPTKSSAKARATTAAKKSDTASSVSVSKRSQTRTNVKKSGGSKSDPKPKKPTKLDGLRSELTRRVKSTADKFMNARVAFTPDQEAWMDTQRYRDVGAAYLIGVVTRYNISNQTNDDDVGVPTATYEIRWTNTAFQTEKHHVHHVDESTVFRGVQQFVAMQKHSVNFGESWSSLCSVAPRYTDLPSLIDEFEEIDENGYREWSSFRSHKELHIDLCPAEVEAIEGMSFSPTASLDQAPGLFTHGDGSTTTKIKTGSKKLFGNLATSSFFAFLPLSLWKQVVVFSNARASASGSASTKNIELGEIMKFLGILWYMALVDKGEMRNYWLDDEEASIFPGAGSRNLSSIMSWRRFLHIRSHLSFRAKVTPDEVKRDPAAKIRPLISMLKKRCSSHVIPGRNIAVDEASIACRSKYARHIIVYNPRKPTGKYHFKLYVSCCSTTWIVLNFKLHCSSDLEDRLSDVVPVLEINRLQLLTKKSSEIRKHVIEVANGLEGSRRVINTDNFYTSCQLLESLRTIGLYGRGTVRSSSKHFPRFTMIQASDEMERGAMKQGVCLDKHIVAASWVDGSIVNVVSNADDSGTSTVFRRIKQAHMPFEAPTCISEYNSAMQGVDRHDQIRGRFSLADGHSFKKWYKKLALAMIDIARCNAYICHQLVSNSELRGEEDLLDANGNGTDINGRDRHRSFVAALVRELFDGSWEHAQTDNEGILYTDPNTVSSTSPSCKSNISRVVASENVVPVCVARESWIHLKGRSRAMRECTVCRFEGRVPTQKTDYCEQHKVALCKRIYPIADSKPHLCQQPTWSCWQKYHGYYFPKQVYNQDGHLMRGSAIYKAQAPFLKAKKATQLDS